MLISLFQRPPCFCEKVTSMERPSKICAYCVLKKYYWKWRVNKNSIWKMIPYFKCSLCSWTLLKITNVVAIYPVWECLSPLLVELVLNPNGLNLVKKIFKLDQTCSDLFKLVQTCFFSFWISVQRALTLHLASC